MISIEMMFMRVAMVMAMCVLTARICVVVRMRYRRTGVKRNRPNKQYTRPGECDV